jgi:hypothetical protein
MNGYCTHKDKEILSRGEAHHRVRTMKRVTAYRCKICKGWHIAHRMTRKHSLAKRYKAAKKAERRR